MGCHQGKASSLSGPDDTAKTLLGNQEAVKAETATGQALSSTADAEGERNKSDDQASIDKRPQDAMAEHTSLRQGDTVVVDGRCGKIVCNPFGDSVDSPVLVSFQDGGSSYVNAASMQKTGSSVSDSSAPAEEPALPTAGREPAEAAAEEPAMAPALMTLHVTPLQQQQPESKAIASQEIVSEAKALPRANKESNQRAAEATAAPKETNMITKVESPEKPARKEKCVCCC